MSLYLKPMMFASNNDLAGDVIIAPSAIDKPAVGLIVPAYVLI
jgi:hypothetical protein